MRGNYRFIGVINGKIHSVKSDGTWLLNAKAHCGLGITDDEMSDILSYKKLTPNMCKSCNKARAILESK